MPTAYEKLRRFALTSLVNARFVFKRTNKTPRVGGVFFATLMQTIKTRSAP